MKDKKWEVEFDEKFSRIHMWESSEAESMLKSFISSLLNKQLLETVEDLETIQKMPGVHLALLDYITTLKNKHIK